LFTISEQGMLSVTITGFLDDTILKFHRHIKNIGFIL
jgi:hypothetical protein